MSAPTVVTASVTTTSIPLTWTAPSGVSAGGSSVSVSSYDLQSSTDGTNWSVLATALTATTYTHTITAGSTTYYYRIRATNKYGTQTTYSASTIGVVGTSVPDQPAAPAIVEEGTSVSITWSTVNSNYATITSYKVFIITSSGSYVENTLVCDGSQAIVVSSRKCLVPMSSLLSSPYTLSKGADIRAKV